MSHLAGKTYLVTGGAGFLGSALVRRLVAAGHHVRVLDNQSRGTVRRLHTVHQAIEFMEGDIRDATMVQQATAGVDCVCHFAFVNGTEFFYTKPDLVLDVGVRGLINVLDACLKHKVGELILASSSEVYQSAPAIPTDETAPLIIPDPQNPRYSYAAGKIISEVMALHYGRACFNRVLVFRPHNVYGPDMGWEHVVPQFVLRMKALAHDTANPVRFPIQGTGKETRSFVYIDDFIDGLMLGIQHGEHLGIYNIGTLEELTIAEVARLVGEYFGKRVDIVPGELAPGGPSRRCPDITKLASLGYAPRYSFRDGLLMVAQWYDEHAHLSPRSSPADGSSTS